VLAPPLEEIRHLARDVVESEHLELVDIEFKSGKSRSLLRIYIDREGGVTLADCELISRQLSAILDVKDLVKDAYILEVSSPGIDRPFKTDRDYERNVGKVVKVQLSEESVRGKLEQVNEDSIVLNQNGSFRTIQKNDVVRAQQEIELAAQPKKNKRKQHR
jgi:ribosome maturation factor RimP